MHLFATEEGADKLSELSVQNLPPLTLLSRPQLDQMLKSKGADGAASPHQGLVLQTRPWISQI